jgi:CDP-glycerol glycerophosphotransferase (TagB/SpsB family)
VFGRVYLVALVGRQEDPLRGHGREDDRKPLPFVASEDRSCPVDMGVVEDEQPGLLMPGYRTVLRNDARLVPPDSSQLVLNTVESADRAVPVRFALAFEAIEQSFQHGIVEDDITTHEQEVFLGTDRLQGTQTRRRVLDVHPVPNEKRFDRDVVVGFEERGGLVLVDVREPVTQDHRGFVAKRRESAHLAFVYRPAVHVEKQLRKVPSVSTHSTTLPGREYDRLHTGTVTRYLIILNATWLGRDARPAESAVPSQPNDTHIEYGMSSPTFRKVLAAVTLSLKLVSYVLTRLLPRDDRLWLFTAHRSGGRFSGNTKYLFLYLDEIETGVRPIWIDRSPATVSRLRAAGYEAYHTGSLRGKYYPLRAGYVFLSHANHLWPYMGGATHIQLWHGIVLKRVGNLIRPASEPSLLGRFVRDHLRPLYRRYVVFDWDRLALTAAGPVFEAFAAAFDIEEHEALVSGYPRNDVLFEDREGTEVGLDRTTYERVRSLAADSTVVSYIPTYRRTQKLAHSDGQPLTAARLAPSELQTILERYDAHLLIKHHPLSSIEFDIDTFERIHVLPPGFDVAPLLKHTDVLVSDYSSVFFDFLLLDRPLVFYPFDKADYERTRGFYFEYESVTPGPKAENTGELHHWLEHFLQGRDGFEEERARVRERFHAHVDGNASERVYRGIVDEQ